jgi:hypothetical protein
MSIIASGDVCALFTHLVRQGGASQRLPPWSWDGDGAGRLLGDLSEYSWMGCRLTTRVGEVMGLAGEGW